MKTTQVIEGTRHCAVDASERLRGEYVTENLIELDLGGLIREPAVEQRGYTITQIVKPLFRRHVN